MYMMMPLVDPLNQIILLERLTFNQKLVNSVLLDRKVPKSVSPRLKLVTV